MRELWLYSAVDRLGLRNYRVKVMTVAFLGTHVPLIGLIAYVLLQSSSNWTQFLWILGVALLSTLAGSGATLLALDHLLRPVLMTGRALRGYREDRTLSPLPRHFRDDVGRLMGDADETLAHLHSALDSLEFSDARTKLPNRKRLALDLQRRLGEPGRLAVCAIRLADYGRLAETLSLDAAEEAAARVAERLTRQARDGARVYRIGAADFVVLTAIAKDVQTFEATLRNCLETCAAPLETPSITIKPALRAGVALAPADASEAEALIDHALGAATTSADAPRVNFHSPAARAAAREQLRLEQEIRRALANDEFVFHFQPVVDLNAHKAVAAEALIRWNHPERGLMYPAKFIGVAESSGLIDQIGLWGLRNACAQIRSWRGAEFAPQKIAVNLSARQFLDPELLASVRRAIDEAGVSPEALEIELTETAAMADFEHTRLAFGKLRDLGVSIAIDDFGTGFASLSYLRKLPFNKLKIDREFVANIHAAPQSQAICRALLALGEGLGLEVLAEGTETAAEVNCLRSLGCSLYQGYYFSKPISAADFEASAQKAVLTSAAFEMRQAGSSAPLLAATA